jgi:colanic acid/amylovoran biosynthesis glycosyltransferase
MPENSSPPGRISLCIFSPVNNVYSETFIRNHIDWLPFHKTILNGTEITNLSFADKPLLAPTWYNRIRKKMIAGPRKKDHILEKDRLVSFLKSKGIQVVLAEYGHIGTIITGACARLRLPLVVHFHGNDASHRPTLELLQKEYGEMFQYASSIISVSHSMSERLKAMGAPADKIIYNCYGIDTSLFRESDNKWETPTFVAVGRFVEKKAPHLTVTAFAIAKKENPSIRLIMIGAGPLLEICKQLVKAFRIEDSVEFAGVQSPAEVATTVSRSLAFVQHSVIDAEGGAEGTPLAILEAGACGIPVISTRHEGIKDIVIEDRTGILVDEFDVEGMAAAMKRLAADPGLAHAMGKQARSHVSANYNLTAHIDKLAEIINRSFQGPHR